jgi:hypothetical protein
VDRASSEDNAQRIAARGFAAARFGIAFRLRHANSSRASRKRHAHDHSIYETFQKSATGLDTGDNCPFRCAAVSDKALNEHGEWKRTTKPATFEIM